MTVSFSGNRKALERDPSLRLFVSSDTGRPRAHIDTLHIYYLSVNKTNEVKHGKRRRKKNHKQWHRSGGGKEVVEDVYHSLRGRKRWNKPWTCVSGELGDRFLSSRLQLVQFLCSTRLKVPAILDISIRSEHKSFAAFAEKSTQSLSLSDYQGPNGSSWPAEQESVSPAPLTLMLSLLGMHPGCGSLK